MLCVSVKNYTRACGPVTGGISDILIGDPNDFNFTQAPAVSGVSQPYTAVALRAGATAEDGAKLYQVKFNDGEAQRTWSQTRNGCSTKYEHKITAQLPQLCQDLTTFLQGLASAGCCCGLLVVIRHNDGKIFVAGEKYVNASAIPKFNVVMDGAEGDSGKALNDFNGANVVLKADYSRDLFEYTGTWASLEALM